LSAESSNFVPDLYNKHTATGTVLLHQSNSGSLQTLYLVWKWTGLHTSIWENKFGAKLLMFRTSLISFLRNRVIFYISSQQNYNQKELCFTLDH